MHAAGGDPASFGDMLRVPGSGIDLLGVKAQGGDVRMVYSPLDAVKLAQEHPDRQVVFFAVGFETTAPGNAMAVGSQQLGLRISRSSARTCWCRPPWKRSFLPATGAGFPRRGPCLHGDGLWEYEPMAAKYRVPIVVTGFEPLDLLQGIYMTIQALEEGRWGVENQYTRPATREGIGQPNAC